MTLSGCVHPTTAKVGAGEHDAAKVIVRPRSVNELLRSSENVTDGEVHGADDAGGDEPRKRRRGGGSVQARVTFEDEMPESVRAAIGGKDARCQPAAAGSVDMRMPSSSDRRGVAPDDTRESGGSQENVVDFEGDYSEAKKMKVQSPVVKPSAEEVKRHNVNHCPYRSWFECCVQGAANMDNHDRTA